MKKFFAVALTAAMGLFYSSVSYAFSVADYPVGSAASGIAGSRHNLGSLGKFLTTETVATTEICVFCHTPHHTNTAVSPTPLWNRVNQAGTYTAYGPTIGGSNITSVGSVSLACLSCHDGVTTFDNLVNAPGAGGVNMAGATQAWRFFNESVFLGLSPTMPAFTNGGTDLERLNIGTSLSNDHPMSVTYSADRASLRPTNTIISTINLTAGMQSSAATIYNGNLTQNLWAIKGYISDTAMISDLLRAGRVECSSCHDPHFSNKSWDEIETRGSYLNRLETDIDGLFLRRVGGNTGSGVCRTCHNK